MTAYQALLRTTTQFQLALFRPPHTTIRTSINTTPTRSISTPRIPLPKALRNLIILPLQEAMGIIAGRRFLRRLL